MGYHDIFSWTLTMSETTVGGGLGNVDMNRHGFGGVAMEARSGKKEKISCVLEVRSTELFWAEGNGIPSVKD
ncbi:hypothetical protein TNCV_2355771 [Trichonephila clavipes]|nr:hypothetical protein TNCV_2355771 [Trichonephila clavipes]